MSLFRGVIITAAILGLMLGIVAVNGQKNVELPKFKSGASVTMGVPVDFNILSQRADTIYNVVESDDSHIVWKFTGTTGDLAFVFADGRIIVASTVDFDLATKDTLTNELGDVMDMLNTVNAGISTDAKNNAANLAIYYANDSRIYHRLKYDFSSNFDYTLVVPSCIVKFARLTITGCDLGDSGTCWTNSPIGQYYYIDNQEVASCTSSYCGGCCYIPGNVDITKNVNTGSHKISAEHIDNPHTVIVEMITSPNPSKNFVIYGPNYTPWINESSLSMTTDDMNRLIAGNAINTTI